MKVIVISEENHGNIGIAADYYSAIHFLIQHYWITDREEVWDSNSSTWVPAIDIFGEKWMENLFNWGIEKFNEFFGEGSIRLKEEEVITYK